MSCTTYPQVGNFSSIETLEPLWLHHADGIEYLHGRISSPMLEFHALRIDLSKPNIQIFVGTGDANGNSTKVSSFVRDNNLTAGINALPFDVISASEGRPIRNMGLVISGGRLLSGANPYYDAIVFYKDGGAAIVSQSSIHSSSIDNIENAVGGFHQILAGGLPAARTLAGTTRHPRSAAGISADGYLYLVVIDGRRTASAGATEHETALLLRSLGAWDALNLDGGGSSALAMRDADGNTRVVNTPVHNGIPGFERAVAGCLGIINE